MNETITPLTVRDFISKFLADDKFFELLPEFSFIRPVASKVKAQNCFCGLSDELNRTILIYNDVVNDLQPDTINKMKSIFNTKQINFSIQTQNHFTTKSY